MSLTKQDFERIVSIASNNGTQNGYWGAGYQIFKNLGLAQPSGSGGWLSRLRGYVAQAGEDSATRERMLRYFEAGPYLTDCKPWPQRGFRLFISHRDDQREALTLLTNRLQYFGIVSFLAHEAIEQGTVWRNELETGLKSMDGLLAYCTDGFSKSEWTGQEVGYALGRRVPVVAIRAGESPPGFLEQFQAKGGIVTPETADPLAESVYKRLSSDESARAPLTEGLARSLKFAGSGNYVDYLSNRLYELRKNITQRAQEDIQLSLAINDQWSNDEAYKREYLASLELAHTPAK